MTDEEVSAIFESVDFDGSGLIHWSEFVAATLTVAHVHDNELEKAFERLDNVSSRAWSSSEPHSKPHELEPEPEPTLGPGPDPHA